MNITADLARKAAAECEGAGRAAMVLAAINAPREKIEAAERAADSHWQRFDSLWSAALGVRQTA